MEPRNEVLEHYLRVVGAALRFHARRAGLDYNDAEDCISDLILRRLCDGGADALRASTREECTKIAREAQWFVKRWIYNRNQRDGRAAEESLDQLRASLACDPVSPQPGPEELIIQDEEIMFVLGVVSKLSPRRQWLWWRVDAEQAQISEVALECGRSANALYLEICRIRRKICSALGAWERE